jgi:hypothetical protein
MRKVQKQPQKGAKIGAFVWPSADLVRMEQHI